MVSFGSDELGIPLSPDELPRVMCSDLQQGQKHGSTSPEGSTATCEVPSPGPTATQSASTSAAFSSKGKPRRINPTILSTFSSSGGGTKAVDQAKEAGSLLQLKEVQSSLTEERSVLSQSKPEPRQKADSSEETPLATLGCGSGAELATDGGATSLAPSDGRDVSEPQASDKTKTGKQPRRVEFLTLSPTPGLTAQPGHSEPAKDGGTSSAVLCKLPETGQSAADCTEVGGGEITDLRTCGDEPMEVQIIE